MDNFINRETDKIRRKIDKHYICSICGRLNTSDFTLMKDDKPECLYACLPIINSLIGQLLNIIDRRLHNE